MKNRCDNIKNGAYLLLMLICVGCAKVDLCDDAAHMHKIPGKTTVTVDWTQAPEGDAAKEMMRFAFYPEEGGEPFVLDTDYGFAQTELAPGNYRVIAFNRKAKNIETTLPADYRRAKASVGTQVEARSDRDAGTGMRGSARAADETPLDYPGWFASGTGALTVDESRTGELVLTMKRHVRNLNIHIALEGSTEVIKNIAGELSGISRSINLSTNKPWKGEMGKMRFNAVIDGAMARFSTVVFGIDPTERHNLSFDVELQDGSVQTVTQDIGGLIENTNETDMDVNLDIVANINVHIPEGGGDPEVSLDEVKATGSTTFALDWGEADITRPQSVRYVAYPIAGGAMQTFGGDNRILTVALAAGAYRVFAYGENAENVIVDCAANFAEATARAVAVGHRIPEPGYFCLGATDVVVEENAMQTFPLPIKNHTKDFRVTMKVKGDGRLITGVEAVLTGVSEGIYLHTGTVVSGSKEFALHAACSATEVSISGRMLGLDKEARQLLRINLTYKNGEDQQVEEDITELLGDFNDTIPEEMPDIEADVEITSPANTNISATITNWKVTERDITPGKGDGK